MADQPSETSNSRQNNSQFSQSGSYNYNEETSSEPVLLLPDPGASAGMQQTNVSGVQQGVQVNQNYREETAAEIAAPVPVRQNRQQEGSDTQRDVMDKLAGAALLGYTALGLAILSLFILPVILGAAGIILGFLAMRKGATKTGGWAIGIGAISLIIGIFITPFF